MKKISKKRIAIWLSFSILLIFAAAMSLMAYATSDNDVVYVAKTGSDTNSGAEDAPVATIAKALEKVADGGKIVLSGTYDASSWTAPTKNVTISGGTLNYGTANNIRLGIAGKSLTFENTNFVFQKGARVFANGCSLTMGIGVKLVDATGVEVLPQNSIDLYAGTYGGTLEGDTNLALHAGSYHMIFGGGSSDTINGNTNVWVGGTTNSSGNWTDHGKLATIYGGGHKTTVKGSTNVVFTGNAMANYIYGGCYAEGSIVGGTNVTMTGGKTMSLYGGGNAATQTCNANVLMTGGELQQLFGGCEGASLTGNVDVKVLGGKVSRRIYGGCYNECHREGIASIVWSSAHTVTGNIVLTLGSGVSVTFDAKDSNNDKYDDRSIYAHSRYKSNSTQEITTLNYAGYTGGVGAQDPVMRIIMGSLSVADNNHTHILAYNDNGATITETCSNCDHSATATISIENKERVYNGQAYTGATVTYDRDWLASRNLTVTYANNVNAGQATASITCGSATASVNYTISKANNTNVPNVTAVNETIKGKADGKINGLATDMEYSTDGTTYTAVTDANMTFASGEYYVRYAESQNYNASVAVKVAINPGRQLNVQIPASQIGYKLETSATKVDWHGSAELTFVLNKGYSTTESFAVKVNGEKVDLNAQNKYVMSNIEADTNITVEGVADITAPELSISIGEKKWMEVINEILFNHFFKTKQEVKLEASDEGSGLQAIYYYVSNEEVTDVTAITNWTQYNGTFDISADNEYVIYAKAIDNAQNIIYVSSEGLVVDTIAPAVTGVENGRNYYGNITFTVSDTYLDSVKVDNADVTLTDGKYTIVADNQKHTISVTDKAGNETTIEITVYKIYTVTFVADGNEWTAQVNHGADVQLPAIPVKEGYTQTAPYWSGNSKNVTGDTTLTAVYTINKYTVNFVVDGNVYKTEDVVHGADVTSPEIPTKEGYTQVAPYWDKEAKSVKSDLTITAVYTINKYEVTYIVDGKEYEKVEMNYGSDATRLEIPRKEGYDKIAPYWDGEGKFVKADATLTAVYTLNPGDYLDKTSKENAASSKLDTTPEVLEQSIPLTAKEKEEVKNGTDVAVWLEVKDISTTVPAEEKALIEEKAEKQTVALYIDATLFKQVGDEDVTKVTKLNKNVKVSIVVPDELINKDEKMVREYKIIRVHEGEAEILDVTFNTETKVLTFETDRFSTYALAYNDVEKKQPEEIKPETKPEDNKKEETKTETKQESPVTGDSTSILLYPILVVVAGMTVVVSRRFKTRNNS